MIGTESGWSRIYSNLDVVETSITDTPRYDILEYDYSEYDYPEYFYLMPSKSAL